MTDALVANPDAWAALASELAPSRCVAASFMRLARLVHRDDRWTGACP